MKAGSKHDVKPIFCPDCILARRSRRRACARTTDRSSPRGTCCWAEERKITLIHIEPGRPMQNGHVESFHGKLRDECLNASWFANLFEARAKIAAWKQEYNEERPHSSLGYLAPREFVRRMAALRSPAAPCERPFEQRNEAK